jgi:hypothetical protein
LQAWPEQSAGAETHAFELTPPIVRGWFGGSNYIFQLVLPDFLLPRGDRTTSCVT